MYVHTGTWFHIHRRDCSRNSMETLSSPIDAVYARLSACRQGRMCLSVCVCICLYLYLSVYVYAYSSVCVYAGTDAYAMRGRTSQRAKGTCALCLCAILPLCRTGTCPITARTHTHAHARTHMRTHAHSCARTHALANSLVGRSAAATEEEDDDVDWRGSTRRERVVSPLTNGAPLSLLTASACLCHPSTHPIYTCTHIHMHTCTHLSMCVCAPTHPHPHLHGVAYQSLCVCTGVPVAPTLPLNFEDDMVTVGPGVYADGRDDDDHHDDNSATQRRPAPPGPNPPAPPAPAAAGAATAAGGPVHGQELPDVEDDDDARDEGGADDAVEGPHEQATVVVGPDADNELGNPAASVYLG
jgi:hypothetical protein